LTLDRPGTSIGTLVRGGHGPLSPLAPGADSTPGDSTLEGVPVILGEVGEALELLGVLVTLFGSLAVMVALGKWWET
jgi:hypothetical protein